MLSFIFFQVVFFGQTLSFIIGKRDHVGFPSRAPACMPSPYPPQNRSGIVVIGFSKTAFFTLVAGHGPVLRICKTLIHSIEDSPSRLSAGENALTCRFKNEPFSLIKLRFIFFESFYDTSGLIQDKPLCRIPAFFRGEAPRPAPKLREIRQ